MLEKLYQSFILVHPKKVLFIILVSVLFLGFHATKLEIDASADTLLLEHDKDLKFSREIYKRYGTSDYLLLAYTPKHDLLSEETLQSIASLSQSLKALPSVHSITSILNVPLLQSPPKNLASLVDNVPTLEKGGVDKELVKHEFLNSPLYSNALVSSDFKTTAILIYLERDEKYFSLIQQKEELELKKKEQPLSQEEIQKLKNLQQEYKHHKEIQRQKEHENIENIRQVMAQYQGSGELFLGGVNMIVDDIITYIKGDLLIYGTTLLAILIAVLWMIFRHLRWILVTLGICLLSVISTSGLLGVFDWQVTVISSNFISLQLIITISIVVHLIVRYNELHNENPHASQRELVLQTVLSKAKPSFFAIITTIAGFSSLMVSDIKPVINLGWMMSTGIAISLLLGFLVFPSVLMLLKKVEVHKTDLQHLFSMTKLCSNSVTRFGKPILIISAIVFVFSLWGASKLIVENSFISYFKQSTPIYQGMKVIDQKLGGTTPLDVVMNFTTVEQIEDANDGFLDSFDAEFSVNQNAPEYWFTPDRMYQIIKVHDYLESIDAIGKVQSLATTLKIGKTLNEGKELESIQLALLYKKLPQEYKDIILSPYVSIENNQVRFTTRIIDSKEDLRRNELLEKIKTDLPMVVSPKDATFQLSSLMVLYNNMLQSLFKSQILTIGIVVGILFIMFLILFRSVYIACIALIVNIIPISIVFGVMGFLNIPLDIMTITIAAISIGIGVDDTIHYIHRFTQEYEKTNDYVQAMKNAHNSIGYAMYYTSLVIVLGFSILVLSNFIPTIYFGLLTVLVMFMVLLADLLLLPKLLVMLKPFDTKTT